MNTRRQFITQLALSAAAVSILPASSFATSKQGKLKNIGFISGILKNNMTGNNWREVLTLAASYGYTEYEGGLKGDSPREFLNFLKSIDLKPIAGVVNMSDDMEKVKQDLDKLNALRMKYAVCYWPWFGGGPFMLEDCKRSAEILNKIGNEAQKEGLEFCWHNHDKEFHKMEEGLPFDYLMEQTDKDLVSCEMDIYWVTKGGGDPVNVLKKYAGRIPIVHVKDMAGDAEKSFTCPGDGIIDFPAVFAEAKKQGIKHYFVERDNAPDGLACLKSSAAYLQNIKL